MSYDLRSPAVSHTRLALVRLTLHTAGGGAVGGRFRKQPRVMFPLVINSCGREISPLLPPSGSTSVVTF